MKRVREKERCELASSVTPCRGTLCAFQIFTPSSACSRYLHNRGISVHFDGIVSQREIGTLYSCGMGKEKSSSELLLMLKRMGFVFVLSSSYLSSFHSRQSNNF